MISLTEQNVISFANVKRMLGLRGIDTTALDELSPIEIEALSNSSNVFTIQVNPALFIVYYNVKFKVAEFNTNMFGKQKEVVKMTPDKKYIFVFKDEINNANTNHLDDLFPNNEVFWLKHTLYRPDMHVNVPPHRKLSDKEVVDLMAKYDTDTKSVFPIILKTDVMAKFVGMSPGDIVEITRSSPTAGTYLYYRVCV